MSSIYHGLLHYDWSHDRLPPYTTSMLPTCIAPLACKLRMLAIKQVLVLKYSPPYH